MAHKFKLSAFGLKLIKAYEGFRPVETTLVSGQRVIGYGHRYSPDEEGVTTRAHAEDVLIDDLAPYLALINENVFAPLSQSQFDSLVSLAFNIGPRAFLSSNVLHMLNNGRPLEAAAGFDEWRKSVIGDKTYVVDALVRRRTAEKALFLRPAEGVVAAPRHEVPPHSDHDYVRADTETPSFTKEDAKGIVDKTPYNAGKAKFRRREDGPAGILTLSEVAADDAPAQTDYIPEGGDEPLSPIALAAEEVSERLDRLIADTQADDTPIETIEEPPHYEEQEELVAEIESKPDMPTAANEGAREDYRRPAKRAQTQTRSPDAYIQKSQKPAVPETETGYGAYWTALIVGTTLLAGGLMKWLMVPKGSLDNISAFAAPLAAFIGAMVVLGALYYLLKTFSRRT